MSEGGGQGEFSDAERRALEPYFTNLDRPIFALRNLPEVVKAALFARYSRSPKSLRRLFLDEFLDGELAGATAAVGTERSERLFQRVLSEYGDDSVAQLGGAHIAVEGASNLLTKVLEWGRLMAYLEQSTRYIPYTAKDGGAWRYVAPVELAGTPLAERYRRCLDGAFAAYAGWIDPAVAYFESLSPRPDGVSAGVYKATIRAKALDALRGVLPAATRSNLGIFGTGQAFEQLILRMQVHPLAEARECAAAMLVELREVIPAFLTRVDRVDRGGVWSEYFAATRRSVEAVAERLLAGTAVDQRPLVTLTDFDPRGEEKVVAAALYAVSGLADDQLQSRVGTMSAAERAEVLRAYVGERGNRRHRPGRAFERTAYRFDVLADYGAFRDLQRHRLLTLEWQRLVPDHGFVMSPAIAAIGADSDWRKIMSESAELYAAIATAGHREAASYVLPMAYRIRFYMEMNAREAMHVIELRTTPQGHPAYREVCQEMHRAIGDVAGHRAIAAAMRFVDLSGGESGRLEAERGGEAKRVGAEAAGRS
jgi:thymidylate synthase ThyX